MSARGDDNTRSGRKMPLLPAQAIRQKRIELADRRAARSLFAKIVILCAALYVLFGLLFGITPMKGGDMEPGIRAGDLLLYYRLQDSYAREDVAVMEREGSQYVGRIIGLPGDTLEITENKELYINGNLIVESDIYFETEAFAQATQYPLTLEDHEYFIMGDHRDSAKDSRYFGPVKRSELKGKVVTAIKRMDL